MRTKMFFMCMMLFGAPMSELPIWGEYTYKMDASMLPVGARAGLSVSPSGLKRGGSGILRWAPADYLWGFDYSPDGRFLVIADTNISFEGIVLFDGENLEQLSNSLAAGCLDGTIRLGNVGPAGRTGTLEGHKASVFKVVFSSDGRTLASGSDDGTVLLWNHEPALSSDNEFPLPSTTFQPEDVNKDGKVNIQDLVFVSQRIGAIGENPADVNQDGFVNIQDLILIAAAIRKA